jgi:hypothetical protein
LKLRPIAAAPLLRRVAADNLGAIAFQGRCPWLRYFAGHFFPRSASMAF